MTRPAPLPLLDQQPPPAQLNAVLDALIAAYHPDAPRPRPERNLLDAVVRILLAQQNTSTVAERQFQALKRTYPRWEAALADGPDGIETVLKGAGGGLARIKAGYIHGVLAHLEDQRGHLHLNDLHALNDTEARTLLESLPGVAHKTASLLLLFDLLRPAMPVDTNIERWAKRLHWVPERWTAQKVERWFDEVVPRDWATRAALHVAGVRHGRQTCRPRHPACPECPLLAWCPSAPIFLAS